MLFFHMINLWTDLLHTYNRVKLFVCFFFLSNKQFTLMMFEWVWCLFFLIPVILSSRLQNPENANIIFAKSSKHSSFSLCSSFLVFFLLAISLNCNPFYSYKLWRRYGIKRKRSDEERKESSRKHWRFSSPFSFFFFNLFLKLSYSVNLEQTDNIHSINWFIKELISFPLTFLLLFILTIHLHIILFFCQIFLLKRKH